MAVFPTYKIDHLITGTGITAGIEQQTLLTQEAIQANLLELGSDINRIVSAQVYIANMEEKSLMDSVWQEWLGDNSKHWPQRACLGVNLEGDVLIEVTVTAVRDC